MQFTGATISYRSLSDKETNLSAQIYDLYIQSLIRLLKMFSYFLLFYCCSIIIFRIIEIASEGFSINIQDQIL